MRAERSTFLCLLTCVGRRDLWRLDTRKTSHSAEMSSSDRAKCPTEQEYNARGSVSQEDRTRILELRRVVSAWGNSGAPYRAGTAARHRSGGRLGNRAQRQTARQYRRQVKIPATLQHGQWCQWRPGQSWDRTLISQLACPEFYLWSNTYVGTRLGN